jgi:hypothetical protein
MRSLALTPLLLATLSAPAAAQISSAPNTVPGTEANPFPVLSMPSQLDRPADHYRHLPSRDLGNAISIQVATAALYDFNVMQMNSRAEDYLQQTANLIYEKAKGPVRIECRSDRGAPAVAQKLAAHHRAMAHGAGEAHQGEVRHRRLERAAAGAARSARSDGKAIAEPRQHHHRLR